MGQTEIEFSEKQATAKGWLAKIENQGILEFASADSLLCDKGLGFGLSDFTIFWISNIGIPSGNYTTYRTSSSGNNRFIILGYTDGSILINPIDNAGGSTGYAITPAVLPTEAVCIYAISFDRDGRAELSTFNIEDPSGIFGHNGGVDISASSTVNIGLNNLNPANFFNEPDSIGLAWMLLCVNRAMTSEEIHDYVMGIGSPNSLPEDLRGVGELGKFSPDFAIEDGGVFYAGSTGSFGNTVDTLDCLEVVSDGTNKLPRALWSLSGDLLVPNGTPISVTGKIYLPSTNVNGNTGTLSYYNGSVYIDLLVTQLTDQWISFSVIATDPLNTTLGCILRTSDGLTNVTNGDIIYIADLRVDVVGQIFSCRPSKSGTHTDWTGNGYNWNNVNNPVIKPFSAGTNDPVTLIQTAYDTLDAAGDIDPNLNYDIIE